MNTNERCIHIVVYNNISFYKGLDGYGKCHETKYGHESYTYPVFTYYANGGIMKKYKRRYTV